MNCPICENAKMVTFPNSRVSKCFCNNCGFSYEPTAANNGKSLYENNAKAWGNW